MGVDKIDQLDGPRWKKKREREKNIMCCMPKWEEEKEGKTILA